jgi:hypothetical protein
VLGGGRVEDQLGRRPDVDPVPSPSMKGMMGLSGTDSTPSVRVIFSAMGRA